MVAVIRAIEERSKRRRVIGFLLREPNPDSSPHRSPFRMAIVAALLIAYTTPDTCFASTGFGVAPRHESYSSIARPNLLKCSRNPTDGFMARALMYSANRVCSRNEIAGAHFFRLLTLSLSNIRCSNHDFLEVVPQA